jgi:hypothetical protein
MMTLNLADSQKTAFPASEPVKQFTIALYIYSSLYYSIYENH